MTTDKRKAQLREAQKNLRDNRAEDGWKRLWIHPSILDRVKKLIEELESYKG